MSDRMTGWWSRSRREALFGHLVDRNLGLGDQYANIVVRSSHLRSSVFRISRISFRVPGHQRSPWNPAWSLKFVMISEPQPPEKANFRRNELSTSHPLSNTGRAASPRGKYLHK